MHHPRHGIREGAQVSTRRVDERSTASLLSADDSRVGSELRVVLHGHPRVRVRALRGFVDENLLAAHATRYAGQDSDSEGEGSLVV